jgi:hypothetical protein
MADLIEARAAEKPDRERVGKLTKQLETLRKQMGVPQAASAGGCRAGFGGPAGQGRGRRWRGGRGPGAAGGGGFGRGHGQGRGASSADTGSAEAFERDRDSFHFLLDNRDAIKRKVKKIAEGVETLTESDDPKIAARIQEHVESMKSRVEEGRPIHMRDPLFAAVFSNAKKISMKIEKTQKGVRVVETSVDPYVARLIQAHAEVVNLFVANGRPEARKNHTVPEPP